MLIYDMGDGTGQRYGEGLTNGHVLRQVVGRFRNYYGVPEISPTQAWKVDKDKAECLPELISTAIDSADVCRYVRIENITIDEYDMASSPLIGSVKAVDAFNTGLLTELPTQLDAVVMWSWNELQLWCVRQEVNSYTDIDNVTSAYPQTIQKRIINNQLIIQVGNDTYTILGTKL
jgi:hypothetical protein